jgi:hypothetical protein
MVATVRTNQGHQTSPSDLLAECDPIELLRSGLVEGFTDAVRLGHSSIPFIVKNEPAVGTPMLPGLYPVE